MSSREPTREEVLAWLGGSPYRTAEDAADHFWPGFADRPKLLGRIRQWVSRAKRAAAAPASNRPEETENESEPVVVEERHLALARLDRLPSLEHQLARLEALMERVMSQGPIKLVPSLNAQITDTRQVLDLARAEGGKVVSLERSPAAVAVAVERKAKRIAELAARARDRDL